MTPFYKKTAGSERTGGLRLLDTVGVVEDNAHVCVVLKEGVTVIVIAPALAVGLLGTLVGGPAVGMGFDIGFEIRMGNIGGQGMEALQGQILNGGNVGNGGHTDVQEPEGGQILQNGNVL